MMRGISDIQQAFYFEDYSLDLDRCLLLRDGMELPLRRQSFEVLRYLVERSGHLVTKNELMGAVWADRAVTDDSITQCLMEIRAALGDKSHSIVKTLPRRGYLFDLPVSDSKPGSNSAAAHGFIISGRKAAIALLSAAFALALITAYLVWQPGSPPTISQLSIAVLPFENRSNREEDQFFTDGIHDDLLATIAMIGSLKVISRTSVMEYRDTNKKIPQIAEELGVANILEGGIQRSGNQVRINVQLIDAATDEHLWAEIYDRELTAENLFAVQSEITRAIANALNTTLLPEEVQRIDTMATENLHALEAYLRGRQLLATRNPDKMGQAVDEFNEAVELDPGFALAWVGVADSTILYSFLGQQISRIDTFPIREGAIKRALAIDPNLGEAYASLGLLKQHQNLPGEAEAAFKKAIQLSPNYATGWQWFSQFQSQDSSRTNESFELLKKAAELDPRSSVIQLNLAGKYQLRGLYTLAEHQYLQLLEMKPGFVLTYRSLARFYFYSKGRFDQALVFARKYQKLMPENTQPLHTLSLIYMNLGDLGALEDIRERIRQLDANDQWLEFIGIAVYLQENNLKGVRESLNRLSSKAPQLTAYRAFVELILGDKIRAREIYLSADPGWLDPDQWPDLIYSYVLRNPALMINPTNKSDCVIAWILMNTGDEELGRQILQQVLNRHDETLSSIIEHPDKYLTEICYLTAGDTERALQSIETQLANNHIYAWQFYHRLPMFDLIRDEPRFLAAQAERERRISVQREAIKKMAAETQP